MSFYDGVALLDSAIVVQIVDGMVTEVSGGSEAERLKETLQKANENAYDFEKEGKLGPGMGVVYAKNSRNLGEIGIGLNRNATLIGNMLEDEKVFGTCHVAIGSNYDEDAPALIHLDGVIKAPTITAALKHSASLRQGSKRQGSDTIIMSRGEHARFY